MTIQFTFGSISVLQFPVPETEFRITYGKAFKKRFPLGFKCSALICDGIESADKEKLNGFM